MEAWCSAQLIDRFAEVTGPGDLRQLHRHCPARYPFLLQSTSEGGVLGRFDILFAFPGETLELTEVGQLTGAEAAGSTAFLPALDRWWSAEQQPAGSADLPFHGGWFLYLGYELAGEIEPALNLRPDPLLPAAFATRCPAALVFDHERAACYLVRESPVSADPAAVREDLAAASRAGTPAPVRRGIALQEEPPQAYVEAVRKVQEHIAAGDVYQANLCREWLATLPAGYAGDDIYAALCSANPGPFAGIARWRNVDILSSSPERLLSVRNGYAATRPIAGTRPRSTNSKQDDSLSTELISHPKEIAEHVMLIDLERNDLGRVCEAGSVVVDEMMVVESYAHVHHIVSNVTGRLQKDVTPGQAIAAVFPGGTITGCPKVRCMEIIAQLEQGPRGAYTGSFGYLNRDGSLDLNILIRTMIKKGRTLSFRAGSGIVADSDAAAELAETRAKAKGMLRALGL
ncbi:MAG: aminodeoxychorismate synthase component I [Woeseiaceae bacterium]|nr:aminodeoxychorismate synthase component I [Woeseiaceae bacterium]